jgi:hypothetical protein
MGCRPVAVVIMLAHKYEIYCTSSATSMFKQKRMNLPICIFDVNSHVQMCFTLSQTLQAWSEPDYWDSHTEGRTNTETIIWIHSSTSVAPQILEYENHNCEFKLYGRWI